MLRRSKIMSGFALCAIGLLLAFVTLSNSVGRTVFTRAANPVPRISQPLVPDAVAPEGAGFPLTMNGTGFVTGSVLNWNGAARSTTFVNGCTLVCFG